MNASRAVFFNFAFLLLASSVLHAGQVANYEFQNSLVSSNGAASLVDLGSGSYVTDSVFGESCTVFSFAEQTGLSLDSTGLFGSSAYSFAALIRLAETDSYAKIMDVRNRALDNGLYAYSSGLTFYSYSDNGLTQLSNDTWAHVIVAFDGSTLRGYVDGVEAFNVNDSDSVGAITSSMLYFFRDDFDTSDDENSAGRVANIQLFDHALSAQEAADLVFSCGNNGVGTDLLDQTITGFAATPSTGMPSGSSSLSATASSGLAVTFGSSTIITPTVCSVSGSTVSYFLAGTCTVEADQAGDSAYNPAPQVLLNILVEEEVVPPVQPPATDAEPIPSASTWARFGLIFVLLIAGIGYTRRRIQ